jgi:hypothetical protein
MKTWTGTTTGTATTWTDPPCHSRSYNPANAARAELIYMESSQLGVFVQDGQGRRINQKTGCRDKVEEWSATTYPGVPHPLPAHSKSVVSIRSTILNA